MAVVAVAHSHGLMFEPVERELTCTGYHGTDAASFAEAVHSALSLDDARDVKMRQAARDRAVQVFSQEAFERGWERHWMGMRGLAVARARERGEVLEN